MADEVRPLREVGPESVPIVAGWWVADAAGLAALAVVASDVSRAAYQQDTQTLWLLVQHSPPIWKALTGAEDLAADVATLEADVDAAEAAIAANASGIASLTTALGARVKTRLAIEIVTTGSSRTLAMADFPADENKLLVINSAINFTLNCPQNSDAAIPVGASVAVLRYHSQTLAIAAGTGATNRPAASVAVTAQFKCAVITKLATNEFLITGDIT